MWNGMKRDCDRNECNVNTVEMHRILLFLLCTFHDRKHYCERTKNEWNSLSTVLCLSSIPKQFAISNSPSKTDTIEIQKAFRFMIKYWFCINQTIWIFPIQIDRLLFDWTFFLFSVKPFLHFSPLFLIGENCFGYDFNSTNFFWLYFYEYQKQLMIFRRREYILR